MSSIRRKVDPRIAGPRGLVANSELAGDAEGAARAREALERAKAEVRAEEITDEFVAVVDREPEVVAGRLASHGSGVLAQLGRLVEAALAPSDVDRGLLVQ